MSSINLSGSALSSLFSSSSLTEASQSLQVRRAGSEDSGASEGQSTTAEADQTRLSQLGQVMSQLQQLSTTDQDGFQAMAKSISDTLAQSASSSTDAQQQKAWADLSTQFSEAAESGDISSLQAILSATAGLSTTASASSGVDTVTISSEGKALAALDESSGIEASSETEKETGSTDSDAQEESEAGAASGSSEGSSATTASSGGSVSGGGSGGSSSSSEKTESEIEDEIDEKERDIKSAQAKLAQAKLNAQGDDSATSDVKSLQSKLDTLNAELAVLQSEKTQAQ